MTPVIEPEFYNVDNLPGIWSPVQWDLTPEERVHEVEQQATASLLWSVDVPEAILRLLLRDTEIERAFEPPEGYDPDQQGEWDSELVTFEFKHPIRLVRVERKTDYLIVEYDFGPNGYWIIEIKPEDIHIYRP